MTPSTRTETDAASALFVEAAERVALVGAARGRALQIFRPVAERPAADSHARAIVSLRSELRVLLGRVVVGERAAAAAFRCARNKNAWKGDEIY